MQKQNQLTALICNSIFVPKKININKGKQSYYLDVGASRINFNKVRIRRLQITCTLF